MSSLAPSRGHLNPNSGATVSRLAPPPDLVDAVVHYWVPEWDLPPGRTSSQLVLTYPVLNLVVQPGATEGDLAVHGPTTVVSQRVLSGRGWAVGALLRPAAVPAVLGACPTACNARGLVDASLRLDEERLVVDVSAAMCTTRSRRHDEAIAALSAWLRGRLAAAGAPDRQGLLANRLLNLLDAIPGSGEHTEGEVPRYVADVARLLGASARTLERVSLAHTGFTPAALVRRRRLQEAADRLRRDPSLDLSELAHEVGYADHAHLTRDFRAVLGFTPSGYRDSAVTRSRPARSH